MANKMPHLGDTIREHPLSVPKVSDRKMVFGVGSGSTGTMSLKAALTTLGVRTGHAGDKSGMKGWEDVDHFSQVVNMMLMNMRSMLRTYDWSSQVPEEMDALVDTPMNEMFVDLFLAYPQAKFILTTRPSEEWAKIRMDGPWTYMPMQEPTLTNQMGFSVELAAQMFDLNNQLIRCAVPQDRLMEIDMFAKPTDNLMVDLSDFVGAARPSGVNTTFPHCFTHLQKGKNNNPFCADVRFWTE